MENEWSKIIKTVVADSTIQVVNNHVKEEKNVKTILGKDNCMLWDTCQNDYINSVKDYRISNPQCGNSPWSPPVICKVRERKLELIYDFTSKCKLMHSCEVATSMGSRMCVFSATNACVIEEIRRKENEALKTGTRSERNRRYYLKKKDK